MDTECGAIPNSNETIAEFVSRHGPVSTKAVASRFGLDITEARARLNALMSEGAVVRHEPKEWHCINRDGAPLPPPDGEG